MALRAGPSMDPPIPRLPITMAATTAPIPICGWYCYPGPYVGVGFGWGWGGYYGGGFGRFRGGFRR